MNRLNAVVSVKSLIFSCLVFSSLALGSQAAKAQSFDDGVAHVWGSIPFKRGADLCHYRDVFSQSRTEYMEKMVGLASDLMQSGALGFEALDMLKTFDGLYEKNRQLAMRGNYMDVTLENGLKGFIDGYYRQRRIHNKRLVFRSRYPWGNGEFDASKVDYIAYGSYSFAPECNGNIVVNLTLIGHGGETETFRGVGKPATVMSQIASKMFTRFQRTQFPSTLRYGRDRTLTLVGALNGSVSRVRNLRSAERACRSLGARLPNRNELELADSYGDWSGGVSLGDGRNVWVVRSGASLRVYHPGLQNPSPVRQRWEVNADSFLYYCVR